MVQIDCKALRFVRINKIRRKCLKKEGVLQLPSRGIQELGTKRIELLAIETGTFQPPLRIAFAFRSVMDPGLKQYELALKLLGS